MAAQRERRSRGMERSERYTEAIGVLLFVLAATAVFFLVPFEPPAEPLLLVGLVLGYAAISRVEFEVGAGYAVPEALLFVPLLFLAPLPLVPVLVALAFLIERVPDFLSHETHLGRWLHSVSDALFTIGPVLVIGLLAPGKPDLGSIEVYMLAFAAQVVTSVGPNLFFLHFGRRLTIREALGALTSSHVVDAVLWPIGFMAAVVAVEAPLILLGLAPLVWLLSEFSRERSRRYAAALELSRAYRGTVMLLTDVVEADDNYTADHCRSVVELVAAVAQEMEIPEDDRQELEFAALLHDVGKIAIPKEILHKPSALSPDEFELMKTHTVEGQQMLDRVGGLLGRVGTVVRSCHERWDGAGYPDGVAGEDIPLPARIVFCCDAYNAMTTDRPYRRAMPSDDALDELRNNAGSQFDPWVVAALVRVVERGVQSLRPTPADSIRATFAFGELPFGTAP